MECWAKDISQCEGPQSGEHYVSKGLIATNAVRIKGLPFCEDELDVPVSGLRAKILCKRHNELLAPLDSEAKRFKDAVLWDPASTQNPPASTRISGPLFARWVAKTYCNFMTLGGEPLDSDFAAFAFGQKPSRSLHLYVWFPVYQQAKRLMLVQSTPEDHFQFNYFHNLPEILVHIRFFGVRFVLANVDCTARPVLELGSKLMIDARDLTMPTELTLRRNLGGGRASAQYEVVFDWTAPARP